MARASATIDIPLPSDQVWQLIGGFGSLLDWLPYITRSELSNGGRERRLANSNGEVIVERPEAFDETGRSYGYSIPQSPFPVIDYLSTLRVLSNGGGSRVEWSGKFTPEGVSAVEASQLFQRIFEDGLKAMATKCTVQPVRDGQYRSQIYPY